MKRGVVSITLLVALTGATIAGITILTRPKTTQASPGVPDTLDARQIQETIRRAHEIEAIAARTFDTAQFSSVFINDPAAQLETSTVQFIRQVCTVSTDNRLGYLASKADNELGYLDYKLAYYAWWREGARRFEALQSAAEKENRSLTQEEMAPLADASGRVAAPRAQGEVSVPDLRFQSIEVNGNTALAVYDDGPRTIQMTLVKRDGQWYLAGGRLLDLHP